MLYLDASALVKRYVDEEGSDLVRDAMRDARDWAMCRIGFVETVRAVASGDGGDIAKVERDWIAFYVIEVDQPLSERAANVAISHGLRSLDALHLAAALSLPSRELTVATWDTRLHAAAAKHGLATLPAALG